VAFTAFAPNVQGTTSINVVAVGGANGVTCTNNPAGKCKSQKVACKKVGGRLCCQGDWAFCWLLQHLLQSTVRCTRSLGTTVGVALSDTDSRCALLPAAPLLCCPSTATFNGPLVFTTKINVVCDLSRTLGQGVYSLSVQATYTGKSPCASGVSPVATGQFFVAANPNPPNITAPVVDVRSGASQKLCRQPPNTEYSVTVDFPFTVTTSTGLSNGVTFDVSAFTSNLALTCSATRSCEYCLHLSF
jgi:hypothetical protein